MTKLIAQTGRHPLVKIIPDANVVKIRGAEPHRPGALGGLSTD